jgi:cholest-4-en-3-one 26-monooxygenase
VDVSVDINLLDLDVFARGMPHEWFTWLRKNAPIYHHPEPGGPGFWVLSKYQDIVDVSRRPELFSSDDLYGGPTGLTLEERQRMLKSAKGSKTLTHMDPPEHTAHRSLVERRFRNRPIAALEGRIREITAALLDSSIARGTCDFVYDVAAVVPTTIIMELMGLPESDRGKLMALANANFAVDDPEVIADSNAYVAAREGFQAYAKDLADQRRREPRDDVITTLVNSTIDDQPLSDQLIALFFEQFVAAGHETTLTAIAQGMNAYTENPDQWRALVDDPSLSTSAAEEVLRWSTPVTYMRRAVREDMNFKGARLTAGDSVTMWYISGNRDEDVFEDPFRFDVRRSPNPHIAFGGGGSHFCLGVRLARLETRVFFEELAKRVQDVELVAPVTPLRSNHFNALKRMPVRFRSSGCPVSP